MAKRIKAVKAWQIGDSIKLTHYLRESDMTSAAKCGGRCHRVAVIRIDAIYALIEQVARDIAGAGRWSAYLSAIERQHYRDQARAALRSLGIVGRGK